MGERAVSTFATAPHLHATIRRELLARTKPSRVPHVLGVEGMSVILSKRWGVDTDRALLAALLHDLAKPYPDDVQERKIREVTVFQPTKEDLGFPKLWHGMIAAQEAWDRYGVRDEEVLEAIAFHSTGRRGHRPIGCVIYVADFLEPSRNWDGVADLRAEVMRMDLHQAACRVAQLKLKRIKENGKPGHSLAFEMSDWLNSIATERR